MGELTLDESEVITLGCDRVDDNSFALGVGCPVDEGISDIDRAVGEYLWPAEGELV